MLSLEQIVQYFPKELANRNPKGVLVEYLQYEILDSLFKQAGSEELSFIGGTAIRLLYDSHRFSEDLDFDNFGLDFAGFRSLFNKVCSELALKGFSLEHEFAGLKPHYHCYIKFPRLLNQLGLSGHREEKILVSIDAELKEKLFAPEIKTLNRFGVYRNLPANPPDILLAQKLLAILFRKREKGRDFYDASFLWGLTKPNYDYLQKRAGLSRDDLNSKLLARCEKLNYKALARDVEPFLFEPGQINRVLDFISFLKEKIRA
jgi:predicted nucleotidyltransferase component of viral defense system